MKRVLAFLVVLASCRSHPASSADACQAATAAVSTDTAVDLLFVVDDSMSMDPIQAKLASNLTAFIERVAQKQRERVGAGKEPFDLYVAVTTTSVLVNRSGSGAGPGTCTAGTCRVDTPILGGAAYSYACTEGPCADIVTRYYNDTPAGGCLRGVMRANGDPFPAGRFVGAGSNPTVLAFTRDLDWAHAATDATIRRLIEQFEANVAVGSCGANQEMPFEAARLAIDKAVTGEQGVTWPHPNSRIGVIFVSNEDDCSTRRADQGGLVWDGAATGSDSCQADAGRATSVGLIPNDDYVRYFTSLARPFSAAFVRPGFEDCAGVGGPGTRTHALATALGAAGVHTVEASVCSDFVAAVEEIAGTVEPPDWFHLPTHAGSLSHLQVRGAGGIRVCEGPDPARDWWYVDCATGAALAGGQTSGCVKVRAGSACEPTAQGKLQVQYVDPAGSRCSLRGE